MSQVSSPTQYQINGRNERVVHIFIELLSIDNSWKKEEHTCVALVLFRTLNDLRRLWKGR